MPAATTPPAARAVFIGRAPSPHLLSPAVSPFSWPTAQTTGYLSAPGYPGSLTAGGTITSNTTYSFKSFADTQVSVGTSGTPVTNVTFYGCSFTNSGGTGNVCAAIFGDGITFSYCTFAPYGITEPGPPGGVTLAQSYQYGIAANGAFGTFADAMTVRYCDFWGFGNGAIGAEGGTQAKPHVYLYNWCHDMCLDATYHGDGIGSPGGGNESGTVISGNAIIAAGNTQALAYQNTAGGTTWDHFTITGNLFSGYGYTVCIVGSSTGDVTNITFTGNTFSTILEPVFGPLYSGGPDDFWTTAGSVWRGNRWLVPAGAAWGNPAHSGLFWMPVDSVISGGDDTPYVSTTDYS